MVYYLMLHWIVVVVTMAMAVAAAVVVVPSVALQAYSDTLPVEAYH